MKYAHITIITNKHFGTIEKTLQSNIAVNGLYNTRLCVIRVIYRNVGLKRFYLPKFLLLSLVFAYIYI